MSLKQLQELEATGNYVFHGSGLSVSEFEPRQAYTYKNGNEVPDGEPAIFASEHVNYAVFMAIINMENFKESFRSGVEGLGGILEYKATAETIAELNENMSGYVHVFNKSDFKELRHAEWVSYLPVKPVQIIKVTRKDFLPEIKLI